MSIKDIKAGKYLGKIVDHGVGTTQKGDPKVIITFEFQDKEENVHTLNWFGYFTGGSKRITSEALVRCGMEGTDPSVLHRETADSPLVLNTEFEFELDVSREANPKTGELWPKLNWINVPGEGGFKDKLEAGEVKQLFGGLDIGGDILEAKKKVKVPEKGDGLPF